MPYRLQKFVFIYVKLFENVRKEIRADTSGRVDGKRSTSTVLMMKYGMATFLADSGKTQCLQSSGNFTGFKRWQFCHIATVT